jgi:ketosteroid isomerase-like protein
MLSRFLILLLALPLAVLPAAAQSSGQLYTATRLQLDVTKVLLAQQRAWNDGNLDGYLSHYKDAPDTQAVLEGPVRGLANVRTAYHTNYPNRESMGTLEQSEIEVRALGDNFALATGRYHLTRSRKKGPDADGGFTEIFEKTAAGWQVIYSETS